MHIGYDLHLGIVDVCGWPGLSTDDTPNLTLDGWGGEMDTIAVDRSEVEVMFLAEVADEPLAIQRAWQHLENRLGSGLRDLPRGDVSRMRTGQGGR